MMPETQERNPYVGPRPFERQDRDLFFGRDRETSELLSLVIAHHVLLLYAQSGAGKTSLVSAGLIPLLEEEGFEVLPLARVSGPIPETVEPEDVPNLYVFNALMSWAGDETNPERLAQMSLAEFLKDREHPTDEEGLPSPRVVFFDQLEELFAFYQERWPDREGFFEQVRDALDEDPLLRVVFVIREDYIAQLDPFVLVLPDKLRTRFRMERLGKEGALASVKGPLRDTKRSFAEGVAEQLVEELLKDRVETAAGEIVEVAGQFIEPVQLQVVCQSLWRDLPPDVAVITQDHLQTFGDVDEALSGFYERSIKRTAQETGVEEGNLRAWFEQSLITPAGTRGTVYRGQEKTGGIPNEAVEVLENLHLIRGEWRAGARWYELTHDRFIEPIQDSNRTWREKRRRTLLSGMGVAVTTIIAVLVIAFATTWTTQQRAEATAAAVGATATQEAQQKAQATATKAAQQAQAAATAEVATEALLLEAQRDPFSLLLPAAWTVEKVEEIDTDEDGEIEWLIIYRYDRNHRGSGGPLGGVVYDLQPQSRESPKDKDLTTPVLEPPPTPRVYPLLPTASGRGYLGENTGGEDKPWPKVEQYDANGDGKNELVIWGYSAPNYPTSLAIFRWVDKERGYEAMIRAEGEDADVLWGDAGIELKPAFGQGPMKMAIVRSRLYHPYWYLRSQLGRRVVYEWNASQTKLEKKSESIDFVFGRPQGAEQPKQKQYPVIYPEAAVLAYYEDWRVKDIVAVQENKNEAQVKVRVIVGDQLVEDICNLTRVATGKVAYVDGWGVSCPE